MKLKLPVLLVGSFSAVLATLLVLAPKSQAASPSAPPQLTIAGPGDFRYFSGFSGSAVKYGPGTVDSGVAGAGPGPWNIITSGEDGGPALTVTLSVQNLGDRTAEVIKLNTVLFTLAPGQSTAVPVIAATNAPIAIRFVGGGTRGKVIWAGR